MAETTKPSPTQKHSPSEGPRPLTVEEIESLRQSKRDCHEQSKKQFADIKKLSDS